MWLWLWLWMETFNRVVLLIDQWEDYVFNNVKNGETALILMIKNWLETFNSRNNNRVDVSK